MTVSDRSRGGNYEWLVRQMDDVIDPVADRCAGWPDSVIRPVLSRAWNDAFGCDIGERALTECAAAIHHERPWAPALWNGGW